jgi:hypothetical protein
MVQRLFNIFIILSSSLGVGLLTAVFFLGSEETYLQQTRDMPEYFVKRVGGGIAVGLFGCLLVIMGNLIFNARIEKAKRVSVLRLFLISLLASTISSAIGSVIFFSN